MSRKLWLCVLMLGLAWGGVARVRADDAVPPEPEESYTGVPGHEDGPAAVDSEMSINAGADLGADGQSRHKPSAVVAPTAIGHATGTYAGVSPGGSQTPAVPVQPAKSPSTITWPGFQMRPDGTSRVFVQSTSAIEAQTSAVSGKFILKFPDAHVAGSTNRLPLETRYFNTPVTKVLIASGREGVTLTLELRSSVNPRVSSERGPSGYYFTYIDLPAGNFLSDAMKAEAAAPGAAASGTVVPPPQPEHMTTLDGNADVKTSGKAKLQGSASASGSIDTSRDNELPPSVKANSKTQGGIRLGK